MTIELPKDAEGKAIPLDTEYLYTYDGEKQEVLGFMYYRRKGFWEIETDSLIIGSIYLRLTKPDTLEQLAADIDRMMGNPGGYFCAYFNVCNKDCKDCRAGIEDPKYTTRTFACDVARRVHHLAGDAE